MLKQTKQKATVVSFPPKRLFFPFPPFPPPLPPSPSPFLSQTPSKYKTEKKKIVLPLPPWLELMGARRLNHRFQTLQPVLKREPCGSTFRSQAWCLVLGWESFDSTIPPNPMTGKRDDRNSCELDRHLSGASPKPKATGALRLNHHF